MLELLEWLSEKGLNYGLTCGRDGRCIAAIEDIVSCPNHIIPFNALMCALTKYLKTQESENERNDTLTDPDDTTNVHTLKPRDKG